MWFCVRLRFNIKQTFIFCRSDALYQPEDLSGYSSTGDVVLDTCTSEHQPENMWANLKKVSICTVLSQVHREQ